MECDGCRRFATEPIHQQNPALESINGVPLDESDGRPSHSNLNCTRTGAKTLVNAVQAKRIRDSAGFVVHWRQ